MRRWVFAGSLASLLGAFLLATPGHAALDFRGHTFSNNGLVREMVWSSDLGSSYHASTPIPSLANDTTYSDFASRSNLAGTASVAHSLALAPAGSWGATMPWADLHATVTANYSGGIYGIASTFDHALLLQFAPASSGSAFITVVYQVATSSSAIGSSYAGLYINGAWYGGTDANTSGTIHYQVPLSGGSVTINASLHATGTIAGTTASLNCKVYGDNASLADVSPAEAASPLAMAIAPNPAPGATRISFDLPNEGPVDVRMHDLGGRVVRILHEGSLPAGSHQLAWDGRDDGGSALPAGVYWARVHSRAGATARRVVLAR